MKLQLSGGICIWPGNIPRMGERNSHTKNRRCTIAVNFFEHTGKMYLLRTPASGCFSISAFTCSGIFSFRTIPYRDRAPSFRSFFPFASCEQYTLVVHHPGTGCSVQALYPHTVRFLRMKVARVFRRAFPQMTSKHHTPHLRETKNCVAPFPNPFPRLIWGDKPPHFGKHETGFWRGAL